MFESPSGLPVPVQKKNPLFPLRASSLSTVGSGKAHPSRVSTAPNQDRGRLGKEYLRGEPLTGEEIHQLDAGAMACLTYGIGYVAAQ